MKFLKRLIIVLVLLGVIVYFGVPALLGTGWATEKIQASIAAETGRTVSIDKVSFGWLSGLQVSGITVDQLQEEYKKEGPLFSLGGMSLRIGVGDLLSKKINVEDFTVREPRIVVIRGADGRFNFSDLMDRTKAKTPGEKPSPEPGAKKPGDKKMPDVAARLDIVDGNILFIDIPLGTRVEMKGVNTAATWVNGRLDLDMDFVLNGGDVKMKASMDLSQDPPPFTVEEMLIDGATLDTNLAQMGMFLPIMGEKPQKAGGKIKFSMKDLSGKGFTLEQLSESLTATGAVRLEGGVVGSGVVAELVSMLSGESGQDGLSIKLLGSTFRIKNGKIRTDDMKLEGSNFDLLLSGSTDLAGNIDYNVTASRLDDLLAKNKNLKEYLGKDGTLPLKLTGTLASPNFIIDVEGAVEGALNKGIEKGLGSLLGGDDEDEDDDKGKKKNNKKNKKKNKDQNDPENPGENTGE